MESPETLTKADLINHLVDSLDLPRKDANLLLNAFLESIVKSLQDGEDIELRGFGSFRLRSRKARQSRNPKSGEAVEVPPKRVVHFKIGKDLKNKLIGDSAD